MKKTRMISLFIVLGFFYPWHKVHSEMIKKGEKLRTTMEKNVNPHRNFNMYMDFTSRIHSTVEKDILDGSPFSTESFKLDIMGKANDKISYRFVQKFHNKKNHVDKEEDLDNVEDHKMYDPITIDLAYLKYKYNEKLSFLIGKQPVSFGGMEYNSKDLHIDRYFDVYKNKENPIGINFIYTPKKNQELQLQMVNSHSRKLDEEIHPEQVNHPMGYSANLNWNLFNKTIQNRWSYSLFQESEKDKFWKLLALGSKLDLKPISIEADYILSDEDIEKNGYFTKIIRSLNSDYKDFLSMRYKTYFLKFKYNFIPKWNFFAKGIYEVGRSKTRIQEVYGVDQDQLLKKGCTYYGGIEYMPGQEDLSLYFLYKKQKVDYMNFVRQENKDKDNHSIVLGLSYRIKLF
ncbi:porin [Blattabacterium cuenoti]|uniref:porin n=1 Tax=Blattabacterium cuenoti TaxID=1653831 RepID=UPI00163C7120|nr:porin [Blattabacterium cuenoti]